MGLGAAQSVQNAGKSGQISIVSVDGIQAALQAVKAGTLSGTVSQYPYAEGQLAVQACMKAVAKQAIPPRVVAPRAMPMIESGRVAVVGSINIDHVVRTNRFPAPGETVLGNEVSVGVGGKGANQAVAAALSGAQVSMFARVGCDAEGELALRRLAERGVDTSGVLAVPEVATGTAWITVTSSDNTIVVVPGGNARWDQAPGADRFAEVLGTAAVTVTQLEVPMDVIERAAASAGGTLSSTPHPRGNWPSRCYPTATCSS